VKTKSAGQQLSGYFGEKAEESSGEWSDKKRNKRSRSISPQADRSEHVLTGGGATSGGLGGREKKVFLKKAQSSEDT